MKTIKDCVTKTYPISAADFVRMSKHKYALRNGSIYSLIETDQVFFAAVCDDYEPNAHCQFLFRPFLARMIDELDTLYLVLSHIPASETEDFVLSLVPKTSGD